MGLNASCFFKSVVFWCVKKLATFTSHYHPAYHSPASFSHTHWLRHRKRWASVTDVGPAIIQHWFKAPCLAIIGLEQCKTVVAQQTQNICIAFVQRRPNGEDVGPTLYKCYTNVLCLLGGLIWQSIT